MRQRLVLLAILLPAAIAFGAALFGADWRPGSPAESATPAPLQGSMKKFSLNKEAKPAPEIRFLDEKDREIGLDSFAGKVVLINLWATWCAPCRAEMPSLEALQKKLGGADFQVVAIAVDRGGRDKVQAFLGEIGIKALTPYLDQSMRSARQLGAPGLPTSVLLDRKGREIGRLIGEAEWNTPEAEALMRWAIAQK